VDVADLKPAMLRADRLAAWDDESVANLKPKECALCREDKHALHPVRLLDGCREATAPLVKWRRSNDVLGRVCRVAFLHSRLAYPFLTTTQRESGWLRVFGPHNSGQPTTRARGCGVFSPLISQILHGAERRSTILARHQVDHQ
jgi:hypothetical protein